MNLKVEGATTLNEGPFEDIRGPERALVELALVMREQGDGTSSLVLEMNDGNSPVKVVEKGEDGTPFIAIDKDCDITFILSPKLRWWFDKASLPESLPHHQEREGQADRADPARQMVADLAERGVRDRMSPVQLLCCAGAARWRQAAADLHRPRRQESAAGA
jgi:hypothetical protein